MAQARPGRWLELHHVFNVEQTEWLPLRSLQTAGPEWEAHERAEALIETAVVDAPRRTSSSASPPAGRSATRRPGRPACRARGLQTQVEFDRFLEGVAEQPGTLRSTTTLPPPQNTRSDLPFSQVFWPFHQTPGGNAVVRLGFTG